MLMVRASQVELHFQNEEGGKGNGANLVGGRPTALGGEAADDELVVGGWYGRDA